MALPPASPCGSSKQEGGQGLKGRYIYSTSVQASALTSRHEQRVTTEKPSQLTSSCSTWAWFLLDTSTIVPSLSFTKTSCNAAAAADACSTDTVPP